MECEQEKGSNGGEERRQGSCSGSSNYPRRETWTTEEDGLLQNAVQLFKQRNWKEIAKCVPGRTVMQCRNRWYHAIDPEVVKGKWTKEEDEMIIKLVKEFGTGRWGLIGRSMPGRVGKQCRERWIYHLAPSIKKEIWTEEEEMRLLQAYQLYGSSWTKIQKLLPGRTDNAIKNHWRSRSMSQIRDIYKANYLLPNSTSHVMATKCSDPGNSMQNKNTSSVTSEVQASTSDTSIDRFCNSNLADELTDIDMIVCGSPLLVEISGEDDD